MVTLPITKPSTWDITRPLPKSSNRGALVLPIDALGGIDFTANHKLRMDYTFTRNSVGYGINSSGAYIPFAIDVPRRLNGRGILLEPERTNLVINNTANSGAGIILAGTTRASLSAGDSPALDSNGKLITQGSGASDGMTFGVFSNLITAGSQHAVSVCVKYNGSARYIRVLLSDNISIVKQFWVDLLTKTTSNELGVVTVVPLRDDWIGLEFITEAYANTTSNSQMSLISTTAMGVTTRAAGNYKMWGGQVEKDQLTVTSPILTSGTALTRAADALVLTEFSGDELLFTFDDDTTQLVSGTDPYAVPTTLDRALVKTVFSSLA